jgi:hypothetical protein
MCFTIHPHSQHEHATKPHLTTYLPIIALTHTILSLISTLYHLATPSRRSGFRPVSHIFSYLAFQVETSHVADGLNVAVYNPHAPRSRRRSSRRAGRRFGLAVVKISWMRCAVGPMVALCGSDSLKCVEMWRGTGESLYFNRAGR